MARAVVSGLVVAALWRPLVSATITLPTVKYLTKDVVILGGGGAGAHAAVRLSRDYGKSILLVEKNAQLVS
jgi:heterodisulfide reductase subunit A-like polyferredoxin